MRRRIRLGIVVTQKRFPAKCAAVRRRKRVNQELSVRDLEMPAAGVHEPDISGNARKPLTITFRHNWQGARRRGIASRKIRVNGANSAASRNWNQMGEVATHDDAAVAPAETALLAALGRRS